MTRSRSTREVGIPLYLIPQAVTRLIRGRGARVYRVSAVRTHYHHYNVSVRTRPVQKELRSAEPVPVQRDEREGMA